MKKLVIRKAKWQLTGQGNIDKKCNTHFRLICPGNQHKKNIIPSSRKSDISSFWTEKEHLEILKRRNINQFDN